MNQETIEQVSEVLGAAVHDTVQQLGKDVVMALLIHYLHELSLQPQAQPVDRAG